MTKTFILISLIHMSCTLSFAQKSASELQQLLTGRWDITNATSLVPKGADSLLNAIDTTELLSRASITFNTSGQFKVGESEKWATFRFGNFSNFAGQEDYEIYLSGTKYTLSIVNDNLLFLTRNYEVGMSISAELKKQ